METVDGMMDFGDALRALKSGHCVSRRGWNGRRPVNATQLNGRLPQIIDGVGYLLTNKGNVAIFDEVDFELVRRQQFWSENRGYPCFTSYKNWRRPKTMKLHQLLNPSWRITDHVDGDRMNNLRSNLRECTVAENNANSPARRGSTSRFKGVSMDSSRGKWISSIQVSGRTKHLGRFRDEASAAIAYDRAAIQAYGKYARLNFSRGGMWLGLQVPDEHSKMSLPYIYMSTVDGNLVPWLASQTDMLATDWLMVPKN